MSSIRRLCFPAVPWTAGGHPLERKKADGKVALLEFERGFEDPNWCTHGHTILVLSGTFELVTTTSVERAEAGEALVVEPGAAHRARNGADVAVMLFVVSDE